MNRTLALKLPIKPVPYSKTPKVKRLPRWSWQDARPAIDFRWHESTLDANVFLFRKFLRMSELDKMLSLTVYVDYQGEQIPCRPRTSVDLICIAGQDWISCSHVSRMGGIPSILHNKLCDPSYHQWCTDPSQVQVLAQDLGMPHQDAWTDMLATADVELLGMSSLKLNDLTGHQGTAAVLAALEKKALEETHYRNGHHWRRRPPGEADKDYVANYVSAQMRILREIRPHVRARVDAAVQEQRNARGRW